MNLFCGTSPHLSILRPNLGPRASSTRWRFPQTMSSGRDSPLLPLHSTPPSELSTMHFPWFKTAPPPSLTHIPSPKKPPTPTSTPQSEQSGETTPTQAQETFKKPPLQTQQNPSQPPACHSLPVHTWYDSVRQNSANESAAAYTSWASSTEGESVRPTFPPKPLSL